MRPGPERRDARERPRREGQQERAQLQPVIVSLASDVEHVCFSYPSVAYLCASWDEVMFSLHDSELRLNRFA